MNTSIAAGSIKLKRAYEPPADGDGDGTRILVDRLWPRGVTKDAAALDRWAKELAPSTELRQWFGHDPARWPEFRRRYAEELRRHRDELDDLRGLARRGVITLVYAAHDEEHNDAVVLREVLLSQPDHLDELLDEAEAESFPASDPAAVTPRREPVALEPAKPRKRTK